MWDKNDRDFRPLTIPLAEMIQFEAVVYQLVMAGLQNHNASQSTGT
jgi:hypothetical protein